MRYQHRTDDDLVRRLVARMHELVRLYPRYGYRFIGAKLGQEGWHVNIKRVYRLWRREGFTVPRKARKKRRLGHSGNSLSPGISKPAKDVHWVAGRVNG